MYFEAGETGSAVVQSAAKDDIFNAVEQWVLAPCPGPSGLQNTGNVVSFLTIQ